MTSTIPAGQADLAGAGVHEQTQARYPDVQGYLDRDGVRVSDRPGDPAAFHPRNAVGDALAVLDEVGAERTVLVAWCGD